MSSPLTWILQQNLRDQRFLKVLKDTLDELGLHWVSETLIPFSPILPELEPQILKGRIVCYGPSFVPRVCDAPAWQPGIFVVEGEVIAGSEYRRAGFASAYPGVPARVQDLVEQAARLWTPAPVVCIDIASKGNHFGIVEANCVNASRFYAANTKRVVEAISSYVLRSLS